MSPETKRENKMKKFKDLTLSATSDFLDRINWMIENDSQEHLSDLVHEITDNNIPIMNRELLELIQDDMELALVEPELGPAFDGRPTVINIVAANVYEKLCQFMHEWVEEQKIEETYPQLWIV